MIKGGREQARLVWRGGERNYRPLKGVMEDVEEFRGKEKEKGGRGGWD